MNERQARDQTLYCERCGISFLWSKEEQKKAAADQNTPPRRPRLCPGCRELLPKGGRERGLVKWFNPRKRYGFLARHGQPDLFVHATALPRRTRLLPGDLVEFTVTETARGRAAVDVILLMHGEQMIA